MDMPATVVGLHEIRGDGTIDGEKPEGNSQKKKRRYDRIFFGQGEQQDGLDQRRQHKGIDSEKPVPETQYGQSEQTQQQDYGADPEKVV